MAIRLIRDKKREYAFVKNMISKETHAGTCVSSNLIFILKLGE